MPAALRVYQITGAAALVDTDTALAAAAAAVVMMRQAARAAVAVGLTGTVLKRWLRRVLTAAVALAGLAGPAPRVS